VSEPELARRVTQAHACGYLDHLAPGDADEPAQADPDGEARPCAPVCAPVAAPSEGKGCQRQRFPAAVVFDRVNGGRRGFFPVADQPGLERP
jgi:hypothetical protein